MKLDFHSQYKLNKQQLVSEVVLNFLLVQKFKSIKIIRKKGLGNKHQYYPSEFIKNKHWILSSLIIATQNGKAYDSSGKVQQTAWGDGVYACAALQHPLVPRHLSGLCRSTLDLNPERRVLLQVQLRLQPGPGQDLPKIEVHRAKWRLFQIRQKSVVGKTLSCFWALCVSPGSSLRALFVSGSGQLRLGKWWENPFFSEPSSSSLVHRFSCVSLPPAALCF